MASSNPNHIKDLEVGQELEAFLDEVQGTDSSPSNANKLGSESTSNGSAGGQATSALKEAAQAAAHAPKPVQISPYIIIPTWITISGCVILFNKYLFTELNFPYPIFLTFYHMVFATIGTNCLKYFTNMLSGLDKIEMTRPLWMRTILPIGALFSASLIFSNTAYLTLSVSFIQMLKAFMPVAVLLISFAIRIEQPNQILLGIVLLISTGCAIAAIGEIQFELMGFIFQSSAIAVESARIVLIQILLQGMKMDPLVSVYFYAPVCAVMIGIILAFTEGLAPFIAFSQVGFGIMLVNGLVAFSLNVASVFLIGSAGGLVLTLAGVVKDILLITISMLIFGSSVTLVQAFGYMIALGGLVLFKTKGGKK